MDKFVTLLIGHRGVGKSRFLKEYLRVHPAVTGVDLDAQIELDQNASVFEIFARPGGEAEFRRLERETLATLIAKADGPMMIAVGAGFTGPVLPGVNVLWVRRVSDVGGRVFLDRPRLNLDVSPHAEYMERFAARETLYREMATDHLTLPEGDYDELLEVSTHKLPYDLTLLPEHFKQWPKFWEPRRDWDLRRIELRDDLLSAAQIAQARATIPSNQILYSRRRPGLSVPKDVNLDWALELGPAPAEISPDILSRHEYDGDLAAMLAALPSAPLLKVAVPIQSFAELQIGHRWWREDPQRRAFLPRSDSGRWQWYRILFGPQMPLHFVREGDGSGLDQPFLWQTWLTPPLKEYFAAVLGHPVAHSLSPREHQKYFSEVPFVAVDVTDNEFASALEVLRQLGLKFVAVTSPLKTKAGRLVNAPALNTLAWDGARWQGANTDAVALKQLGDGAPSVWIWGRGALLESIKSVWPNAEDFSAREGTERTDPPDLLIWASGRGRTVKFPPVKVSRVLDLNYGANSPGLEYAQMHGLPYQSGLKMFKLQAEAQQSFWATFR